MGEEVNKVTKFVGCKNIMENSSSLRSADLRKVRLGRYPFKAGIKYYEAKKAPYLSTSTMIEVLGKLNYIGDIFFDLRKKGAVGTTDPRYITGADVEEFLLVMKRKQLEISTRKRYISTLNSYLQLWGNDSINQLMKTKRLLPPKPTKEIRALSIEEIGAILVAAEKIEGHIGYIIRGMIALSFATGIRPKESIRAEIRDIDLKNSRFYVRHPKGEEAWAAPQWVDIIRGDMMGRLELYTEYRESICPESPYLFPNKITGEPYSSNNIRRVCRRISEVAGIQFRMKDFRSSLASITISDDLSRLKAVSLQLRHSQLATTERYYAKIQRDRVKKEIGSVWKEKPIQ